MDNKIILYSTNCPKCNVLKKKLEAAHIEFEEVNDIDVMISKGIMSAPVLQVKDKLLQYLDAVKYVNERVDTNEN